MKKFIYFSLSLLCLFSTVAQANSIDYKHLWKEIETCDKKDLPKSALKITQKIRQKARLEHNTDQWLAASLRRIHYRYEISKDSFYVDITALEKEVKQTKDPIEKSFLHLFLGDIYLTYYKNESYKIGRISIKNEAFQDLRLLTADQIQRKIKLHFSLALKEEKILHNTLTSAYPMLIKQSSIKNYYGHELYHFIAAYMIKSLHDYQDSFLVYLCSDTNDKLIDDRSFLLNPLKESSDYSGFNMEILRLYQKLLRYYEVTKNENAYVLTELSRLNVLKINSLELEKHWDSLIERFSNSEVIVEVYAKKIALLIEKKKTKEVVDLLTFCLNKYKDYERISVIKNFEKKIKRPSFSLEIEKIKPYQPLQMTLRYKDMEEAKIEILRVKLPGNAEKLDYFHKDEKRKYFLRKYTSSYWKKKWLLRPTPTHEFIDSKLDYPGLPPGVYVVRVSSRTKDTPIEERLIHVTGLKLISFFYPDNSSRYVVVDAESGQPIEKAKVMFHFSNKKDLVVKTNSKGEVRLSADKHPVYAFASTSQDNGMKVLKRRRGRYGIFRDQNKVSYQEKLYTDRSIYRPGQIVHVAGWYIKNTADSSFVVANRKVEVKLYDANRKLVETKETTTNAYGSYALDFLLPKNRLSGYYVLRSLEGSTFFRVEEYKRPTFRVELFSPTVEYNYGDSLTLKGKATRYSGVPVQHATVHFSGKITSYWGNNERKTWELSNITTDEKGEFETRIYLDPLLKTDKDDFLSTSVTVTDATGETQDSQLKLPLQGAAVSLSTDINRVICKERLEKKSIQAFNLAEMPQQVKGEYKIYALLDKVKYYNLGKKNPEYNSLTKLMKGVGNCLLTQSFESNRALDMKMWKTLPSGAYRMIIKAKDKRGEEAWVAYDFVYYSLKDKHVPFETSNWFQVISDDFDETHPGAVVLGTKEKDVFVYCQILANGVCLEQLYFQLSNEVKKINIPYKEEYGYNAEVSYVFVKHGEVYKNKAYLTYLPKNKEQKMKWSSFRDALQPGQKETWELQVESPDGAPADAEVLATLYDASLDELYRHDWNYISNYYRERFYLYCDWNSVSSTQYNIKKRLSLEENNVRYNDEFYTLGNVVYRFLSRSFNIGGLSSNLENVFRKKEVYAMGVQIRGKSSFEQAVFKEEENDSFIEEPLNEQEKITVSVPNMRSNFAETAFFYPQLKTDKKGKVRFSFTLPDALTTWKFMAMSHSKNMDYGKLIDQVTAKKDFMISPNVPRFVRAGDRVVLTSNIMNLSARMLKGRVEFEIFNPATDKVLLKQQKKFQVKEGETKPVEFSFKLKDDISLLAFRVKGVSGNYSDGEQHYLPVLSSKQWITQSLPLVVTKAGKRSYDLHHLFNDNSATAAQRKLTLELSSHPFWTAIQALPSLSQPHFDDAISLSSAYYANKMATAIVQNHPRIAQVIQHWKMKEPKASPLALKEDLKQMLLLETPWMRYAEMESLSMQLQSMLLDENITQTRNHSLVTQLKDLQNKDGGFSWFKGMSADVTITMEVARILTRLRAIEGVNLDYKIKTLLKKAQHYLSNQIIHPWYLLARDNKMEFSYFEKELIMDYLYLMSFCEKDNLEKRMERYFLKQQFTEIQSFTIYGKAMSALLLSPTNLDKAKEMLASIREYAVTVPNKGSYFDTEDQPVRRRYSIPRQVAVMEAAHALGESTWVKELGLWLLLQKQVQQWSSPLSTVNAIYALTSLMPNLHEPKKVEVKYGGELLKPKENITGSIKKVWQQKEIPSVDVPLLVSQDKDGLTYGALYAQYLENVDKVKASKGALSIKTEYYKVFYRSGKETLVLIDKNTILHKGDKIVSRMQIRCDDDFDYLQLKVDKAACLEVNRALSGYCYEHGLRYYCAPRDASINYFFNSLSKGVYSFETTYHVVREGVYETGISTLQSAYNPSLISHSPSLKLNVK
jgi:hypothetical protein